MQKRFKDLSLEIQPRRVRKLSNHLWFKAAMLAVKDPRDRRPYLDRHYRLPH